MKELCAAVKGCPEAGDGCVLGIESLADMFDESEEELEASAMVKQYERFRKQELLVYQEEIPRGRGIGVENSRCRGSDVGGCSTSNRII